MSDLIDRDETIKQFCKQDCDCDPKDCLNKTCYEVEIIESMPSVKPTRPTPSNTLDTLDLISRQETIKEIYQLLKDLPNKKNSVLFKDGVRDGYARAIGRIRSMPSAQPRKGKWIYGTENNDDIGCIFDLFQCSECEYAYRMMPDHRQHIYNYCPNCGSYNGGE